MDQQKLDSLIRRYEEVYTFATRSIDAIISEQALHDLTPEQFYALRYLTRHGPCPTSELADICGVNRSAVTAMIDRLAAKGYVSRLRDEADRRVVFLEATEAGHQVHREGEGRIFKFVESYLQELEEDEVEAFVRIYEKIGEIIRRKNGGA